MACYEWKCTECDHEFETLQKMSAPNPLCPECLGTTEKQISSSNFKLKGPGWGKDGYGKEENG